MTDLNYNAWLCKQMINSDRIIHVGFKYLKSFNCEQKNELGLV